MIDKFDSSLINSDNTPIHRISTSVDKNIMGNYDIQMSKYLKNNVRANNKNNDIKQLSENRNPRAYRTITSVKKIKSFSPNDELNKNIKRISSLPYNENNNLFLDTNNIQ